MITNPSRLKVWLMRADERPGGFTDWLAVARNNPPSRDDGHWSSEPRTTVPWAEPRLRMESLVPDRPRALEIDDREVRVRANEDRPLARV